MIGIDGKIMHVFEKVKPVGHDQEVLSWLKEHPVASHDERHRILVPIIVLIQVESCR